MPQAKPVGNRSGPLSSVFKSRARMMVCSAELTPSPAIRVRLLGRLKLFCVAASCSVQLCQQALIVQPPQGDLAAGMLQLPSKQR